MPWPLQPASCFSVIRFHFPGRTKNLPLPGIIRNPGKDLLSSLSMEEQRSVLLLSTISRHGQSAVPPLGWHLPLLCRLLEASAVSSDWLPHEVRNPCYHGSRSTPCLGGRTPLQIIQDNCIHCIIQRSQAVRFKATGSGRSVGSQEGLKAEPTDFDQGRAASIQRWIRASEGRASGVHAPGC